MTSQQTNVAHPDDAPDRPFSTSLATTEMTTGAVASYAREQHELQAAYIVAKSHPRNEAEAFAKISRSCERPTFAQDVTYSFPRGGAAVEGPSVYLAREMARCWGNIRHGIRIVTADREWTHVEGWAMDMETNTRVGNESRFSNKVQRKRDGKTLWVDADERDRRELVNKHGAICVRNALLQLLPSDLVDEAVRIAKETLERAAAGALKQNPEEAVRRMVRSFGEVQVTAAMLESFLGHPLTAVTPEELARLRAVYVSIRDGHTKREDHFDLAAGQPAKPEAKAGAAGLQQTLDRARGKTPEPAPPAEAAREPGADDDGGLGL